MTTHQINELLEIAGEGAPRIDAQRLAGAARAAATRRRRVRIAAVPTVAVAITAGAIALTMTQPGSAAKQPGSGSPSTTASVTRGVIYTCCSAEDVSQRVRPGGTFVVHWMVKPSSGDAEPQTLGARLTGPYSDVGSLKSGAGGVRPSFSATAIALGGAPGNAPVSLIHVPADAQPGIYQLITTTAFTVSHETGGGSAVVSIAP